MFLFSLPSPLPPPTPRLLHVILARRLLEIELDGIFRSILLLKKKKYAAMKLDLTVDGRLVEVMEQKGLDIVRRDWCPLSKDEGNFALAAILSGRNREEVVAEIHQHLRQTAERLRAGQVGAMGRWLGGREGGTRMAGLVDQTGGYGGAQGATCSRGLAFPPAAKQPWQGADRALCCRLVRTLRLANDPLAAGFGVHLPPCCGSGVAPCLARRPEAPSRLETLIKMAKHSRRLKTQLPWQIPLGKFIITKQLTKRPEDYPDAKNQPHVQVALRRRAAGKRDGVLPVRERGLHPAGWLVRIAIHETSGQ